MFSNVEIVNKHSALLSNVVLKRGCNVFEMFSNVLAMFRNV